MTDISPRLKRYQWSVVMIVRRPGICAMGMHTYIHRSIRSMKCTRIYLCAVVQCGYYPRVAMNSGRTVRQISRKQIRSLLLIPRLAVNDGFMSAYGNPKGGRTGYRTKSSKLGQQTWANTPFSTTLSRVPDTISGLFLDESSQHCYAMVKIRGRDASSQESRGPALQRHIASVSAGKDLCEANRGFRLNTWVHPTWLGSRLTFRARKLWPGHGGDRIRGVGPGDERLASQTMERLVQISDGSASTRFAHWRRLNSGSGG